MIIRNGICYGHSLHKDSAGQATTATAVTKTPEDRRRPGNDETLSLDRVWSRAALACKPTRATCRAMRAQARARRFDDAGPMRLPLRLGHDVMRNLSAGRKRRHPLPRHLATEVKLRLERKACPGFREGVALASSDRGRPLSSAGCRQP